MTASIPRLRRYARFARDEYALSQSAASGLVRRPTRTCSMSGMNIGESPSCPAVQIVTNGRPRPSTN